MGPTIAFLGMGGMGKAMTRNLVQSGSLDQPITLYNRTKSTADEHSETIGHSIVASTAEEAISKADIIWSCLQDGEAVRAIIGEAVSEKSLQGKLFVDSSSIAPEDTRFIADRVAASQGEFISMPVMGEPMMAERKLLHCIAAGKKESIDRIKPFIVGIVGQSLIELDGEPPEKASLLKLMGNVLIMLTMETVAEVNVFGEKCGLGVKNIEKLMSAMFPRPPHSIYNTRMISGGYFSQEAVVEAYKASRLASHVMQLAKATGASIPGYEVAARHLKAAEEHSRSCDISGIYGAIREDSGLAFENLETGDKGKSS